MDIINEYKLLNFLIKNDGGKFPTNEDGYLLCCYGDNFDKCLNCQINKIVGTYACRKDRIYRMAKIRIKEIEQELNSLIEKELLE